MGSPGTISRKILHGGQRMANVQNSEEIFLKNCAKDLAPLVERTNVTDDRQTTDGFAIAKTERNVVAFG